MSCARLFHIVVPSVCFTFTLLWVFASRIVFNFFIIEVVFKACTHIHRFKLFIHCITADMQFQNALPYSISRD